MWDRISDPNTFLGRVPSWVYGVGWSLGWLLVALPVIAWFGLPAGFLVAMLAFGITLWIGR